MRPSVTCAGRLVEETGETTMHASMSRRSPLRILIAFLSIVLVTGAIAVGWHYANRILGPDRPKVPSGQAVLAHTESTVTLAATFKARRPGHWALVWPGGFGHVDSIVSIDGELIVRRFHLASGSPPGDDARLAGFAVDADPRSWL